MFQQLLATLSNYIIANQVLEYAGSYDTIVNWVHQKDKEMYDLIMSLHTEQYNELMDTVVIRYHNYYGTVN